MRSINANLILGVWVLPTLITSTPMLTKSDQPIPCGLIGDAGCQRLKTSLVGANIPSTYYESQSAAEGAGWVFGTDDRATWCGPDDSVNVYHDVINVQRNGNLPIAHDVNCTASCSICGGQVHGCTVPGPNSQSQCFN